MSMDVVTALRDGLRSLAWRRNSVLRRLRVAIDSCPLDRSLLSFRTLRDAKLDGTDVVLWHVFGLTHVVRTEDAPVMPCETVGFHLRPCGFFDVSPCVDVPCTANACAKLRSRL